MFSTTSESSISELLRWLDETGVIGLKQLSLKSSSGAMGMGCFARRDIACGETLFIIPQGCILGFKQVFQSSISTFIRTTVAEMKISQHDDELVSEELLYWLYMIHQRRADSSSPSEFNIYLSSLDLMSPSLLGWTDNFEEKILEPLRGTNLVFSLQHSLDRLHRQANLMDAIRAAHPSESATYIPQQLFNFESLLWARGHYLARRYPAKFALPIFGEDGHAVEGSSAAGPSCLKREAGLESRGCLVPLLDILNHNHDHEWLTFKVESGCLHVICNHPLSEGSEIFSNYGGLSNEKLLFAYGFALPENPFDAFAVKLKTKDTGMDDSTTFYLRRGGISGVPKELWTALRSIIRAATATKATAEGMTASDGTAGILEETAQQSPQLKCDEVTALMDYLGAKMEQLQDSEENFEAASEKCLRSLRTAAAKRRKKRRRSSVEKEHGKGAEEDGLADELKLEVIELKVQQLSWYLKGQVDILTEALTESEAFLEARS